MEQLKQAALVVCTASILAGILQQMLPKKEQSAGIKLVVGLYILLTLLQPAAQLDWSGLLVLSRQQLPQTQAVDVEGAVAAGAKAQLRQQLQQALDSQAPGSRVADLQLDYNADTGAAAVAGLRLEGPAGCRQAALQTASYAVRCAHGMAKSGGKTKWNCLKASSCPRGCAAICRCGWGWPASG